MCFVFIFSSSTQIKSPSNLNCFIVMQSLVFWWSRAFHFYHQESCSEIDSKLNSANFSNSFIIKPDHVERCKRSEYLWSQKIHISQLSLFVCCVFGLLMYFVLLNNKNNVFLSSRSQDIYILCLSMCYWQTIIVLSLLIYFVSS